MENHQIFVLHWSDGAIAEAGVIADEDVASQVIPTGATRILLPYTPDVPDARYWYVKLVDNTVVKYTAAQLQKLATVPAKGLKWDVQVGDFVDQRAKSEVQSVVWDAIQEKRSAVEHGGVKVQTGVDAGGLPIYKWFHSDMVSRAKLLGVKDLARDQKEAGALDSTVLQRNAADIQWKTMDGSFVPMTVKLAYDIVSRFGDHDAATYTNAESHRNSMMSSVNPAAYDFSTGWPETYA